MVKEKLKRLIDVAAGREPADVLIKNCKVINVFSGKIREGEIAIAGDMIAGIGEPGDYEGREVIDAEGKYASPGFIDSHIHIESSYVSPEEIGRLLVPHGGTTIIADPHEIVNVCGLTGLRYMIEAAKNTKLDIRYVLPSCVPATPFEHSGAIIDAKKMEEVIDSKDILGLGEFMDFPGVISARDDVLDKLVLAQERGKLIDGHCPSVEGKDLNAYAAARIRGDHECSTLKEMNDRLDRGLYVLLRQGSACHNLRPLIPGITQENSRRLLLCSDDRQPKTMIEEGHLDNHLRIMKEYNLDPVMCIRMATLNAAECFGLDDLGALAPGYRANIVLMDDLESFRVAKVWIDGELCAEDGKYLPEIRTTDISPVRSSVHLKDFSAERLKMHISSGRVHVIEIMPGGVVTAKAIENVKVSEDGDFIRDPEVDIVKVAVVERHQETGNVALGLLKGYGIKRGAVGLSIAHDSHNLVVVGVDDDEIASAVTALKEMEGGMVLIKDGQVIESMPLPIAGLMSDQSGEWISEKLTALHEKAYSELGVDEDVEPIMTLCFMSLAVIPEIKLTDMGLFDIMKFDFIPLEAN